MPSRTWSIHFSGRTYRYGYGGFYLHSPYGFVECLPPVGIVVPSLPSWCSPIVVEGCLYYVVDGVWYLPVPGGYLVVTPPRSVVLGGRF